MELGSILYAEEQTENLESGGPLMLDEEVSRTGFRASESSSGGLGSDLASEADHVDMPSVNTRGEHKWLTAFQQVLPIYLIVHVVFLVLTFFSALFILKDFSNNALPIRSLLQSWNRWDSGHYAAIATQGYDGAWRTAFFPLFPLLEHVGAFLTHDPFLAGLVLSNITDLLFLIVLYQLVREDFGDKQAQRCVLYLSIFPS